jgi:hypothetical protein
LAEPAHGYGLSDSASRRKGCAFGEPTSATTKSAQPEAGSAISRLPVVFQLRLPGRQSIITQAHDPQLENSK